MAEQRIYSITDIEDGKVRPIDRESTVEVVLREWLRRHPTKSEKDRVTCDTFVLTPTNFGMSA